MTLSHRIAPLDLQLFIDQNEAFRQSADRAAKTLLVLGQAMFVEFASAPALVEPRKHLRPCSQALGPGSERGIFEPRTEDRQIEEVKGEQRREADQREPERSAVAKEIIHT